MNSFDMVYCSAAFPPVFLALRCAKRFIACMAKGNAFVLCRLSTSQLLVYVMRIFVGMPDSYGSPVKRNGKWGNGDLLFVFFPMGVLL